MNPSRRKILWFLIKSLLSSYGYGWSKGQFSFVITDEDGNYEHVTYRKGNTYQEIKNTESK